MSRKRRNILVVTSNDESEDIDTGLPNTKTRRTIICREFIHHDAVEIVNKPKLYKSKKEQSGYDKKLKDYDDKLNGAVSKMSQRKLKDTLPSTQQSNIIQRKKKSTNKKATIVKGELDKRTRTLRCRHVHPEYTLNNYEIPKLNTKPKFVLKNGKTAILDSNYFADSENIIPRQKKTFDKKADIVKGEIQHDRPTRTLRCRHVHPEYTLNNYEIPKSNTKRKCVLKNDKTEIFGSNYVADSGNSIQIQKKTIAKKACTVKRAIECDTPTRKLKRGYDRPDYNLNNYKMPKSNSKLAKYKSNVSCRLKKTLFSAKKERDAVDFKVEAYQVRPKIFLSTKSSSSPMSDNMPDNILEKKKYLNKKLNHTKKNSQGNIINFMDHQQNKENFTPSESHSTPAVRKKGGRLNDSLFGFNLINSPFSTVIKEISNISGTSNISVESKLPSLKRGFENKEQGFHDLPMEIPKQKRKKKLIEDINALKLKKSLDDLRAQFEAVERHELVIEYN